MREGSTHRQLIAPVFGWKAVVDDFGRLSGELFRPLQKRHERTCRLFIEVDLAGYGMTPCRKPPDDLARVGRVDVVVKYDDLRYDRAELGFLKDRMRDVAAKFPGRLPSAFSPVPWHGDDEPV